MSIFRKYYERGDFPITKSNKRKKNPGESVPVQTTLLQWTVDPKNLDYAYYLPVIVNG